MTRPRSSVLGPRLLLIVILSGCSFFSRTKNTIYSLDRSPAAAPVVSVTGLPIGIDSVELPPGFDRREIVVRQANQQLEVRGTQQWSATLQDLVLHTLAFDVANRLPEGMVILPGAAKPAGPVRSIDVAFEQIGAGPERAVVLDAHWTLREPGRPDIARHERISIDVPSLDSAQIATGMSQAVAALADRIVGQIAVSR
jgi:uncharacterized protein